MHLPLILIRQIVVLAGNIIIIKVLNHINLTGTEASRCFITIVNMAVILLIAAVGGNTARQ